MGEIKLVMVDTPAGYDQADILVTRVELHKKDINSNNGTFIINVIQATYDLLKPGNGASIEYKDSTIFNIMVNDKQNTEL